MLYIISDTQKIQLTLAINFFSSRNTDKECIMHSVTNNIQIMINDQADKVVE